MKPERTMIAVILIGLAAFPAWGDLITVGVEGVVERSNLAGVGIGTAMSGYVVYDTASPDTDPSNYHGLWELESLVMTVGEYRYEHGSGAANKATFKVWATDITYLAQSNGGVMLRDGDVVTEPGLEVTLLDLCNASSTGPDAFPTSIPYDIDFFSYRNNWIVGSPHNEWFSGEITWIGIIPEPASLSLILLGAVFLRRRK